MKIHSIASSYDALKNTAVDSLLKTIGDKCAAVVTQREAGADFVVLDMESASAEALLEEGVGLSRATAALVWMVASLSNIPSRLLGGFFGDRLPKNVILGIAMIFMAVAMYLLAIAASAEMAFAYAVLLGIGWGIQTPLVNAIQGEFFGRKSQGIIRGWLQTLSLPINIAVPIVAGYMADVQGTYRPTFTVIALVILVGSIMVFLTTRPKPTGYRERLA